MRGNGLKLHRVQVAYEEKFLLRKSDDVLSRQSNPFPKDFGLNRVINSTYVMEFEDGSAVMEALAASTEKASK